MSSILTNNGAMVALQTLRGINDSMLTTQNEISTGKSVATAKDNAAVWAISKVMEADVKGFNAISDSLNLGKSTVAVARNASESITSLLTDIKEKIVNSQEANVDRKKIQNDIVKLRDQITSVVGAAQFNGLNLVNGKSANPVQILSSLDRASDGTVTASKIDVATVNLSASAGTALTTGTVASASVANGANATAAIAFAGTGTPTTAKVGETDAEKGNAAEMLAGDVVEVTVGDKSFSYSVQEGNSIADIATGLTAAATAEGVTGITITAATTNLQVANSSGGALDIGVATSRGKGDLADLAAMDVTTNAGASDALSKIEGMLQKSIEASASFGSVEKRVEIQSNFVSKLTDALKSGIGAMVDADMEETSARLQALQVQQQLGTQALSIANKAPQALLSLFR